LGDVHRAAVRGPVGGEGGHDAAVEVVDGGQQPLLLGHGGMLLTGVGEVVRMSLPAGRPRGAWLAILGAVTAGHWLRSTPPERLEDPTLTLRRPTDDDAAALLDAVTTSLAELTPWMAWATPGYGEEQVRGYLELSRSCWDARREFTYAIVDADGVIAGMVGLMARL